MESEPDTSPAAGADTLIGVLAEAGEHGYQTQQIGRAAGRIECAGCDRQTPAADFDIDRVRRLEGASDAADLLLVLWSRCPSCGRRGVLTLGYGPNASDVDTTITQHIDLEGADPSPSV